MMPSGRCYTSFTFSYLSRALVLLESLRRTHPDWQVWAVVVDQPPAGIDPAPLLAGFDRVLGLDDLAIPRPRAWLFKHDLVEACTAVKGPALLRLLDPDTDIAVYFDPDIALFHPIEDVIAQLETASIVLTPHQLEPNTSERRARGDEGTALRYGVFNLGFLAVRNDANGRAFAAWWTTQLLRACYDDVPNGIFTDQKYVDLVPALFEGVHIMRDPGCNVASWNISRRRLAFALDGSLTVNGSPLKFYHFTKIGGIGDGATAAHGAENPEVLEVWHWYRRRITAGPAVSAGWWHYGAFADGTPIPRAMRLLWRTQPEAMALFDDPFAVGPGSFREWALRQQTAASPSDSA